ncbi:hypothetical protein [Vibrio coralliilyticus]|uniref:hypothetical protein n=1 Tax=Vibrio coralliilyticus TaxID=190893 RepID=UPI00117E8055|nr:hypothetical protein [Vibrio coralliilyticus]
MSFKINKIMTIFAILAAGPVAASGQCYGKISRLWVDTDQTVYFNIEPTGQCVCNYAVDSSKGFSIPRSQENRNEQYSALLAAFMASKVVNSQHDWTTNEGSQRCLSHSIVLGDF